MVPVLPTTLPATIAAPTERVVLSTATTLITANRPKIAEDLTMARQVADGRVDLARGHGSTGPVRRWSGRRQHSVDLAVENHGFLRRLRDEEVVDRSCTFSTPLHGSFSTPHPRRRPPVVGHGAIRRPPSRNSSTDLFGEHVLPELRRDLGVRGPAHVTDTPVTVLSFVDIC